MFIPLILGIYHEEIIRCTKWLMFIQVCPLGSSGKQMLKLRVLEIDWEWEAGRGGNACKRQGGSSTGKEKAQALTQILTAVKGKKLKQNLAERASEAIQVWQSGPTQWRPLWLPVRGGSPSAEGARPWHALCAQSWARGCQEGVVLGGILCILKALKLEAISQLHSL